MRAHTQESETAVFTYLVMFAHRVRKRHHTTTGSCADPTCAGFTEITKAAAVRNVSNEGTGTNKRPFGTES
jgi:hypothetical protein